LERYCSAKAIPYPKGQRLSPLLVAAERSEAALGDSCHSLFLFPSAIVSMSLRVAAPLRG
jgi:hypothetical protein